MCKDAATSAALMIRLDMATSPGWGANFAARTCRRNFLVQETVQPDHQVDFSTPSRPSFAERIIWRRTLPASVLSSPVWREGLHSLKSFAAFRICGCLATNCDGGRPPFCADSNLFPSNSEPSEEIQCCLFRCLLLGGGF